MAHTSKSKKTKRPEPPCRILPPLRNSRRITVWLALLGLLLVGGGIVFADWWIGIPEGAPNVYVGRQSCIECHADQSRLFHGSHHDLAMDLATEKTVLGDFNNAKLEHYGIESMMFNKEGKYFVHTEGPDGKMDDFPIKYVFGVEPLQQYMVEFDRPSDMPENEIARVQVLRISWDTEKKRWFYLPPPDVDEKLSPEDDLHWTGVAQRWNTMCADCHSTNLQKNYDPAKQVYHTTFSEIDVSCEACHGPGGHHVQLAKSKSLFWDRKRGYALAKLKAENADPEIETCAPCHSRRRVVHPHFQPGKPFYDFYANELLQQQTYHADGQILDEVYVYGSFLQSKMHGKGIRCTDCHDPHTARLKHEGNRVCTSCHAHPEGKYDHPSHHNHRPGSKGASCVECHMPEAVYMEVDPRRDHSLRVPRPDLSVKHGTPNACTRCHLKVDADKIQLQLPDEKRKQLKQYNDWVVAARRGDNEIKSALRSIDERMVKGFDQWYRDVAARYRHQDGFTAAMTAAQSGDPQAEQDLEKAARNPLLPAIQRASALAHLLQYDPGNTRQAGLLAIHDPHPMVRAAGLSLLDPSPSAVLVKAATPLLADPSRMVREEAGRVLSRVPLSELNGPQRKQLMAALDDLEQGLMYSNDRAMAYLSLGGIYENLGETAKAQHAYLTALRIEPTVTGPRANLAALLDAQARQAEQDARQAITSRDQQKFIEARQLHEKLQQEVDSLRAEELNLLLRDAALVPDNAPIQYRLGLALYLHGKMEEAESALRKAHTLQPDTPDFVMALALLYEKQQRWRAALEFAHRLIRLRPDEDTYRRILSRIESEAAKQPQP